ncbi:preprotein translocase subunit SecE [Kriegella sp. EG-1]|nr:preprotein translocase subunit SecE [Flavobacteriaceae bacterium EG-1]
MDFNLKRILKTLDMFTYIKESIDELKNNVTLPPKAESTNLMVVVAVFSIIFALATWGVDSLFGKLVKLYFNNILN